MDINRAIGKVLREMRVARSISQERVSASQSDVSDIERVLKSLIVEKLDEFAQAIGVHPATILVRCYELQDSEASIEQQLERNRSELELSS